MQNKTSIRAQSPRSHRNDPAFPAQWFYGLLRALPGDQACLTPSPARLIADLTPALGRQNDTTWPYASALFVNCAAASTASRPASVTIAKRPSEETGPNRYSADFTPPSSEISENQKLVRGPLLGDGSDTPRGDCRGLDERNLKRRRLANKLPSKPSTFGALREANSPSI